MEITEFLLACIAEEGAVADRCEENPDFLLGPEHVPGVGHVMVVGRSRVLAECEAKRRIVERHSVIEWVRHEDHAGMDDIPFCSHCGTDLDEGCCPDLLDLASVYSDHPDFDEDWKTELLDLTR